MLWHQRQSPQHASWQAKRAYGKCTRGLVFSLVHSYAKNFRDEDNLDISTTPCFASGGFLQVTLSPAQELSLNKFKTAYALTCSPFGECYAALFQVGRVILAAILFFIIVIY